MMTYNAGDWVVYDPGYKQEIGRVTECYEDKAYVCYHQGCTSASTPLKYLRLATDDEIAQAPEGIGYHRFDATCQIRDEWLCQHCMAVRGDA